MQNLTETSFLKWATENGMGLDERYLQSAVLGFKPDLQQHRFWEVPAEPERRPYFIASLLSLLGDWNHCYVWRHLGSWPESADPTRINDQIELQILRGIGLPLGSAHVVVFTRAELDQLITLIFSTTIFGWSVGEDLYIVPDNAQFIVKTDHHGAIHVAFKAPQAVSCFIVGMDGRGFPLPEDIWDDTFKRPEWMKDK